ncbi:MAG: DUF1353 domain-containing protein [Sphingomonadaceae bacterium]
MTGFSGLPTTVWLTDVDTDRNMELTEDFWFDDAAGKRWDAPKTSVINGASIPQALWSTVGSPYTGRYRRASIVHDVACGRVINSADRRAADRMFYEACRAGGCNIEQATLLYTGVRLGALWDLVPFWKSANKMDAPETKMTASISDRKIQSDFAMAAEMVTAAPPTDDVMEMERRVDAALSHVSGFDLTNR